MYHKNEVPLDPFLKDLLISAILIDTSYLKNRAKPLDIEMANKYGCQGYEFL